MRMPVLDLDEFIKKNAQEDGTAEPAKAPVQTQKGRQGLSAFFSGNSEADPKIDDLLTFKSTTETTLVTMGQDFYKISQRVAALETAVMAASAKTAQALSMLDRVQPDNIETQLSDIRAQISAAKNPERNESSVPTPEEGAADVQRLEKEYVELASRIRPFEAALEQLNSWSDRQKDFFAKAEQTNSKLADIERTVAQKAALLEQAVGKPQFEDYAKTADTDRQQLRASITNLTETISKVSSSVDRMSGALASGAQYTPEAASAVAKIPSITARLEEQALAISALSASNNSEALANYSKELEKARAEVSANYEQVKAVERLLTAQSNKMQSVFAEIQKNLSEYKQTSDVLNSTHDAVLKDIRALKDEHEQKIGDYRRIATELSAKVDACAAEVAKLRSAQDAFTSHESNADFFSKDGTVRPEQALEQLAEATTQLQDLTAKVNAFSQAAEKMGAMDSLVTSLSDKVSASESNNAALFANIASGFKALKDKIERASPSEAAALAKESERVAALEQGFASLGSKLSGVEQGNEQVFAGMMKGLSKLRLQVEALAQESRAAHEVKVDPDEGRVTFSTPDRTPKITAELQERLDMMEKSITILKASMVSARQEGHAQAGAPDSFREELAAWASRIDALSERVNALQATQPADRVTAPGSQAGSPQLSQLSARFDMFSADVGSAFEKMGIAIDEKIMAAEQSSQARSSQEFTNIRNTLTDAIRSELVPIRATQEEASASFDGRIKKLDADLARVAAALADAMAESEKKSAESFAAIQTGVDQLQAGLSEAKSRADSADASIATLTALQDSLKASIAELEKRQAFIASPGTNPAEATPLEAGQSQLLAAFEAKQSQLLSAFEAKQAQALSALEAKANERTGVLDALTQWLSDRVAAPEKQTPKALADPEKQADLKRELAELKRAINDLESKLPAQQNAPAK